MIRTAKTKYGVVEGMPATNPRITVYRGVPFAKPPVGDLRWRAPEKPDKWEGVYKAYTFKNISVQDTPGLGDNIYVKEWSFDSEVPMGEDNLYLNIWTPAQRTDEKLPVLVWYFGGGFQWGYPYEMEFDPENMCKKGIIVVSVNYRLGVLGFLAHPELTKNQPDAPTNFGSLDQKAGLEWVYENIEAFGGDPKKISLGGQSAGGASVLLQITHEPNYGKIHTAFIQSGIIRNPYMEDKFITPQEIKNVEKIGEDFFEFIGVKNLDEARKLDAFFIRDKYAEFAASHPRFSPCIDHVFCLGEPFKRIENGDYCGCPVMSGNTKDEFPTPKELLPKGDTHEPVNGIEVSVKAVGKSLFEKGFGDKMYYYRFNSRILGEDNPGTFHSVDLWFFFESIDKCWRPFVGKDYDLARKMCTYWVNFIKNGDPNGCDVDGSKLPEWKPCGDVRNEMEFVTDGPVAKVDNDPYVENLIRKLMY